MRFLKLPFIYWLLLNCIPFIGFELHSGNIKPGVFFYLGALTIITSGIWLFFCLYFLSNIIHPLTLTRHRAS